MLVYTIGYGSRTIGDFLNLLRRYTVGRLVDTRSLPYSRFRPDFRKKSLQDHLEQAGIAYWYLGDVLGGKKVDPDCLVGGQIDLEKLYAKDTFRQGIAQVVSAVHQGECLALMCAELRPQNCHRSWMLAAPLEEQGIEVQHIDELGGLKTQQEVRGWFGNS